MQKVAGHPQVHSECIPIHGISQHYLAVHMAFGYYYF